MKFFIFIWLMLIVINFFRYRRFILEFKINHTYKEFVLDALNFRITDSARLICLIFYFFFSPVIYIYLLLNRIYLILVFIKMYWLILFNKICKMGLITKNKIIIKYISWLIIWRMKIMLKKLPQ